MPSILPHVAMCSTFLARTRVLACLAITCLCGTAAAQPGGDVYVSGLRHTPIGGAVLGPVDGRSLSVGNLGTGGGVDGVSIQCDTMSGVGCDIDLTPVLQTAGAVCSVAYKGWDGTIKGRIDMQRAACCDDDDCNGLVDFTSLGATGVHWIVRDRIGDVLAEGEVSGPVFTFRAVSAGTPGPFNPSQWNIRTRLNALEATLQNIGIIARRRGGDVQFEDVLLTPIEHASSIECFPIICITSPCPGQWGNVSAMEITATGLSGGTMEVSSASRVMSIQHGADPASVVSKQLECWGLGDAHADEVCALPAPAVCIPEERRLEVNNIGASGNDGVEIDFTHALSLHSNGIVHRDLAARSFDVGVTAIPGGGGVGGGGGYTAAAGCCRGNVTLIKLHDDVDLATGGRAVSCDASGRGASSCLMECLDSSGVVLGSEVVAYPLGAIVLRPSDSYGSTLRYTSRADGAYTFDFSFSVVYGDPGGAPCIFPSGLAFAGVDSLRFTPVNPTEPPALLERCVVTGYDLASLTIDSVSCEPPQFVSGLDHAPLGGASITPIDPRSVEVNNIGSSGNDGVEVKLNARGGGVTVDLSPLLGPSTLAREITCRYKGWDGTIKGNIRIVGDSDGDLIETHDFSALGSPSVHWRFFDAAGSVLAQGTVDGSIAAWGMDAAVPPGESFDKQYFSSGSDLTIMREAHQGFFDIAVTITGLTPLPIFGVYGIEVTPEPCAGLPENCPPEWTNSASMLITATGIPDLTVSDAHLRFGQMQGDVSNRFDALSCCARGRATIALTELTRDLVVSNIGSDAQDGVSISFFETTTPPAGAECSTAFSYGWAFGNGGGGGGGGEITAAFIGNRLCQGCPPGEVVYLQVQVSPDPNSPPAVPAELIGFDASARGAAVCAVSLRNSLGAEIGSLLLAPTDRLSVPNDATGRHLAQRREGFIVELGGVFDVRIPGGGSIPGVAEIRATPINPTIEVGMPFECVFTGEGVDEITIHDVTVIVFCPADFDHNGLREVSDIFAFLSAWFAQSPSADFDGVGGIAVPDIFAFLSTWFAGCP